MEIDKQAAAETRAEGKAVDIRVANTQSTRTPPLRTTNNGSV